MMSTDPTPPPFLRAPLLEGTAHGFLTRRGGTSHGIYASLNCGLGTDDERANILENRARAASCLCLGPDAIRTVRQEHGTRAILVDGRGQASSPPDRADAMVTKEPGIALCILTADCAPVLFVDSARRVAGAAHAGWRGALNGVLEATLDAMRKLGASDRILAAIGPCIGPETYEIGPEFHATFLAEEKRYGRFFRPSHNDRYFFDLPGFIEARLAVHGVRTEALGLDTYTDSERFFSYRRSCHRSEPDYGRLISLIALAG